jgi:succinylarginine dihydrolase
MPYSEYNFDGLIGPTHNYAGLSFGNVASMRNVRRKSSPRQAALQGLAKMRFLSSLGVPQAVLPPHERPHLSTLRRLGFTGKESELLRKAYRADPALLAAVCSASAMWAANAATVSPAPDTADRKLHLTPASLLTQFHRSIEPTTTTRILRAIFQDARHFVVHDPLPPAPLFADEGAANFMRLAPTHGHCGIECMVFGRDAARQVDAARFPARQTRQACEAVFRLHQVSTAHVFRQSPVAIDAGAFHNDVVAVAHRDRLLIHEQALSPQARILKELRAAYRSRFNSSLRVDVVPTRELSLPDTVESYLFNSQIVDLPQGGTAMIAPAESAERTSARGVCDRLVSEGFVDAVHFVDVRQSMRNGGGPACLRLRIVLSVAQADAMSGDTVFTPALDKALVAWVEKHYRDELDADDLADPMLLRESRDALNELTRLLRIGSVYDFQL